jgi:uncharacterized membrane protein YeaQ/YmgE (transglycosylase-associated protein family)
MNGYGIIMSIILGGVAGVVAEKIMNFNTGLVLSIILGIVGAVVGNFLLGLVGVGLGGIVGTIITAIVGACVVIWLYRMFASR